jgi:rhodanese-related sulfurtransferase
LGIRKSGAIAAAVAGLLLAGSGCSSSSMALVVGIDEVTPAELHESLARPAPPLVVDVRGPDAYRAGHIADAVSLSLDELEGYFTRLGPPLARPLSFVCHRGMRSVAAAAAVAALGYSDVSSLAGGMTAWRAAGFPTVRGDPVRPPAALLRPPRLALTGAQEFLEAFGGFVVKPGYMLLALVLVFLLRRSRERDLVLIFWSLVAFLVGETACYVNMYGAHGLSTAWELLHGAGMLVQNVLLPWGVFVFLDRRVLRFTDDDAACAGQRLCGRCWKRDDVSCGLQRVFLIVVVALGALALFPLSAPLRPAKVMMSIYGIEWPYFVSLLEVFVEFRIYAGLALLFLAATLVLLLTGRTGTRRAQLPFFLGFGFLVFPLLRFFLLEAYRDMPVWAEWWEEATEFLAVAGLGFFLWVFRRPFALFGTAKDAAQPAQDDCGSG